MAATYDPLAKRWYFDSVQDFWDTEGLEEQPGYIQNGPFEGKLRRGVVQGRLRDFSREDVERGIKPDTLIILHVLNYNRQGNYDCKQPPPQRTGLFSAFMDEVEEVAFLAGCRSVVVDAVYNKFLRKKLEKRGYLRVPSAESNANPDYAKFLSRR